MNKIIPTMAAVIGYDNIIYCDTDSIIYKDTFEVEARIEEFCAKYNIDREGLINERDV